MALVIMPPSGITTSSSDLIAAFAEDECVGVDTLYSTSVGWRGILLVQEPTTETIAMQIRYYSGSEKRIFVSTSTIDFKNDGSIGTIDEPLVLMWK